MKTDRRILFNDNARFAVAKPSAGDGKAITLTGYAVVWNVLSSDRGGYKVRLKPGSATIAQPAHALFHHDYRLIIGTTENNSLRFTPDDVGLQVEIDLPDTSAGRDVAELVGKRYVRGMSFAMVSSPRGVVTSENGQEILDVEAFALDEVTITPIPAFSPTSIDVKANSADQPPVSGYSAGRASDRLRLDRHRLNLLRP